MAIERKKRLKDGSFSEPQKVGQGETLAEKAKRLEQENITNMLVMTELFETNIQLQEENIQLMLAITDLFEMVVGGEG